MRYIGPYFRRIFELLSGGAFQCSEHISPRNVTERWSTASEREWRTPTAEKSLQDVALKAEQDSPIKGKEHTLGLTQPMEKSKKVQTLKENHLFSRLYSRGKSVSSKTVAVYSMKNYAADGTRVGITVSKSRGNAVVRNHTKRKLREAYRALHPLVKENFLIVIVARQACVSASVADITEDLYNLLQKAALLKNRT